MAYNKNHIKVDLLFDILGTTEVAETGFRVANTDARDIAAVQAKIEALDESVIQGWGTVYAGLMGGGSSGPVWAPYSELNCIKLSAVNTAGKVIGTPRLANMAHAGTGSQVLPQDTVCCSLTADVTRGQGVRGRMYLPHTRMQLSGSGPTADNFTVNSVATGVAGWLTGINTDLNIGVGADTGWWVGILSSIGAGTARIVTGVSVGNVNDTQRRRRNGLGEVYQSHVVTI